MKLWDICVGITVEAKTYEEALQLAEEQINNIEGAWFAQEYKDDKNTKRTYVFHGIKNAPSVE